MRIEFDLERGVHIEEHLKQLQLKYRNADYQGYILAARAREMQGQFSLAQRYYGQAERRFRDVAPIPLAWLNVQRGLMAMHSGEFEAARTFFQTGYERCPNYPMAIEHLAEIEGRLGNLKRATELYEAVIKQTRDPEYMAALAEIYLQQGLKEQSKLLINQADARFRELEKLIPEAISGHAADFYLGLGNNSAQALKLLQRNHELRPNTHAKQALADVLIEFNQLEEASQLVQETLASPVEFAEKYWTAARLEIAKKASQTEIDTYLKKAYKLNPKIAELEGELPIKVKSNSHTPSHSPSHSPSP